jgi:hypothetical protein
MDDVFSNLAGPTKINRFAAYRNYQKTLAHNLPHCISVAFNDGSGAIGDRQFGPDTFLFTLHTAAVRRFLAHVSFDKNATPFTAVGRAEINNKPAYFPQVCDLHAHIPTEPSRERFYVPTYRHFAAYMEGVAIMAARLLVTGKDVEPPIRYKHTRRRIAAFRNGLLDSMVPHRTSPPHSSGADRPWIDLADYEPEHDDQEGDA